MQKLIRNRTYYSNVARELDHIVTAVVANKVTQVIPLEMHNFNVLQRQKELKNMVLIECDF